MKKVKLLLCVMFCMLFLGGCGKTFSEKELKELKENATTHSQELHKYITFKKGYEDAVLLETVCEYTDFYDDSASEDWLCLYSKYQLQDGSIVYFNTVLADMQGVGELPDYPVFFQPFEESEYNYTYNKSLAETGKVEVGDRKLKSVGEDVYAQEGSKGTTYYFIIK